MDREEYQRHACVLWKGRESLSRTASIGANSRRRFGLSSTLFSIKQKKNRLTGIESHQTDQIYSEKQLWFYSLSRRDQMVCELVSHNEWEWRLGKSILYHTRFNYLFIYFWMWLFADYRLQNFKRWRTRSAELPELTVRRGIREQNDVGWSCIEKVSCPKR